MVSKSYVYTYPKCHVIISVMLLYCISTVELLASHIFVKKHYLWAYNLAALSTVWKETHACSINELINVIHLIWQS